MKRVRYIGIAIATIVVLTIAILDAIATKSYLKNMYNEANTLSEIVSEYNFRNEEIVLQTKHIDQSWEQKEKILCLLVNHKDIENMGECIDKMITAQNEDEWNTYIENLNLIKFYASAYEHLFSVSIQNIL